MTLFKKTTKQQDFSQLNKMYFGFPGTGKTTLASQMTDDEGRPPAFIPTEEGLGALEVFIATHTGNKVSDWDEFGKTVQFLIQNKEALRAEHSCLVIDLVSDLDLMCADATCKELGIKHLSDADYGKGFQLSKKKFRRAITALFDIMPVTFICHSKDKEMNYEGEKVKIQSPSLSAGAFEFVNGKVDLIAFLSPAKTTKDQPKVILKNSRTCIAKSRFPQLVGEFDYYPDNPAKTYQDISTKFSEGVQ